MQSLLVALICSATTTHQAQRGGGGGYVSTFGATAASPSVGLGNVVRIDIDTSGFVLARNGTVVWPFVNGTQFGAFATCAVQGRPQQGSRCSLLLPLPYVGEARLELAVFREGRSWGGMEGAWGHGMGGPCNQTAGCVYQVGQAGPGSAAVSTSAPMTVRVTPRRITLPGGVADPDHQVCMDIEPWFTKLNINRWEGRAGASGMPLVGFYSSLHPGVIRQHAMWLTEAGVTCVNVDWTNMLWNKIPWSARGPNVYEIVNATTRLLEEYAAMLAEGHDAPRVMVTLGLTVSNNFRHHQ